GQPPDHAVDLPHRLPLHLVAEMRRLSRQAQAQAPEFSARRLARPVRDGLVSLKCLGLFRFSERKHNSLSRHCRWFVEEKQKTLAHGASGSIFPVSRGACPIHHFVA
ncbi:hypothetical protein, partial [Bordetella bronchiseptica]|uniref:hypothetical protein n=2 Tax=Bordetella bronchiseptica TaxID=518 RepID=UPI001ED99EAE